MKSEIGLERRGRARRTVEQRRELVAVFRRSGLGKAEFCRRQGVNLATFYQWLKGRGMNRSEDDRSVTRFAEVRVPLPGNAGLEIELPSGIRLKVSDRTLLPELAGLIRELSPC